MRRVLAVVVLVVAFASPAAALPPDAGEIPPDVGEVPSCVLSTWYRPTKAEARHRCGAVRDAQVLSFRKGLRWTSIVTPG